MSSLRSIFSIRNVSLCLRPTSTSAFRRAHVARAISCNVPCKLRSDPVYTVPVRGFRSSLYYSFAKKKKGGKGKGGPSNEDAGDEAPAPPDMKEVEAQMDKRITRLKEEFSKMHNSRVNKDMFNNVMVDAYGSKSAIPECGQVSVQTASKVVINVFDASIVPSVTKALRECGLNLNPIVDGSMVSVPVPKASKEKREDMVKLAKKAAEKVL